MRTTFGLAVILFGVLLADAIRRPETALASTGVNITSVEDGDFADFLANQQLVIEATVVGLDTVRRVLVGGCGLPPSKWTRSIDVRLRVDRVLLGVAEDETIMLTFGGVLNFPGGALRNGAPVIAWAYRNCADGWRLWGGLMVRTSSGYLVQTNSIGETRRLSGQAQGSPIKYALLEEAIGKRAPRHAVQAFTGKGAVALVRIVAINQSVPAGVQVQVESLAVLMGSATVVPHSVTLTPLPSCFVDMAEGDSLLVPIPADHTKDDLNLDVCPYGLLVRQGFARGLGVPLEFVPYTLEPTVSGLRVKPCIAKD